ncbi:arginine transporter [Enterococcus faecium]|uniref:YjiH family protein n=1 Tax=Enterococcus faecium TaxID=1352 RepID=UPI002414DB30|nr:arginine transporter [Enterococcus faecium]MDG4574139.1 arginine transporter [Enterococcus faecium]
MKKRKDQHYLLGLIKFVVFTILGTILVLVPFSFDGSVDTILFHYLKIFVKTFQAPLTGIMVVLIVLSAILAVFDQVKKDTIIRRHRLLNKLFSTSLFYTINRVIGAIISLLVYFKIGPNFIASPDTGGTMLSLATQLSVLVPMMLLFQTFILEFGAMEFLGEIVGGIVKPIFKVSEICAVNIISAWVGPGNVAIMATEEFFAKGYFTVREMAVIGSQFATGSIGWIVLVSSVLNVIDYFGLILAGLAIVSVIVASISVRIPPLSTFPDTYMNGSIASKITIEKSGNWFTRALNNAVDRANESNLSNFVAKIDNMTFYVFWLTPIIVCWGTLALVISLYTPLLKIISMPVEWILMAFGIASPDITASAIMSGLADNYLPVILGQSVESTVSRVIIAMMSIIQIIYLSETATLLISTNKHMKFWHVIVIFLERTFLSLFFVILIAKFFVR